MTWAATICVTLLVGVAASAALAQPIRIGELNSYRAQPAFLEPYRNGWRLAAEEVNATGGVRGHQIEVVSRDDGGTPGDAVRVAESLVLQEGVTLLFGTFLSNVGLAVSDFAKQRKVTFLAAEPLTDKITWQLGNRYTFRLAPSTYMQVAALVPQAAALKKKRWAIAYPNYEYGQSAVASFKQLMAQAQPDIEYVAELAPTLGKVDAGAVAQALSDAKPDAIFNVLFGADLAKFAREGAIRGTFKSTPVVSLLTGWPEYLEPLKDDAPEGWYVTGYPGDAIPSEAHRRFAATYRARWKEEPKQGSLVGYIALHSVAAVLRRATTTNSEDLVRAFKGLTLETPLGRIEYRAADHQATLGTYVGRTARQSGKGVMIDYRYVDGAWLLPTQAEVRKLRPSE